MTKSALISRKSLKMEDWRHYFKKIYQTLKELLGTLNK